MSVYRNAKYFRVLCAITVLLIFSALFILPEHSLGKAPAFQFLPALLKALAIPGFFAISAFLFLAVLTLLFGRVYCSFLCPLGILQDIIIRLKKIFMKKTSKAEQKQCTSSRNFRVLRYSLLLFFLGALLAGTAIPLGLFEPFAIFGRFVSALIKPIFTALNNALLDTGWFESLYPLDYIPFSPALIIIGSGAALLVAITAFIYGRLFCNTLCPVGALLGILSRVSWFKIAFDSESCVKCGRCADVCKAGCIDYKNTAIDNERCVKCFNCLNECKINALNYAHQEFSISKEPRDISKRDFIKVCTSAAAGTLLIPPLLGSEKEYSGKAVMPPGAMNFDDFTSRCTACQLCVSNCPNTVMKPALTEYGLRGFMQPRLDFSAGICEFECTVCSNICPNGALQPLTESRKKLLQIGQVKFAKKRCVVVTNGTYCGACGEHCPTGAIKMVEWHNGLTIPQVDIAACIGCGACENICPALPVKAMIVKGLKIQGQASEAKPEKPAVNHLKDQDFPF